MVAIYDVEKRESGVELRGHEDCIMWTGWSPSGRWVMTVCWDRTVRLWDAASGSEMWKWKTKGQNWTGCFGPVGRVPIQNSADPEGTIEEPEWVLATCGDGTVHCWSTIDGSTLWTYSQGRQWCRAVAISHDGRFTAIGGQNGGKISILDLTAEVVDGKRTACMERSLGSGGVKVLPDANEEEEKDEEKKLRAARRRDHMVIHMIECQTVRFLLPPPQAMTSGQRDAGLGGKYRLGYTASIDSGVEVYDFETNKKWRCEPEKPPPPEMSENERRVPVWNREKEVNETGLIGWEYVEPSADLSGRVMSAHSDGVRFWDLVQ